MYIANTYDSFLHFCKNMWFAKQKQLGAVKRALPSNVESLVRTKTDIKLCQVDQKINHNKCIKTAGKNKDWYQLAAKWIIAGLSNAVCNQLTS